MERFFETDKKSSYTFIYSTRQSCEVLRVALLPHFIDEVRDLSMDFKQTCCFFWGESPAFPATLASSQHLRPFSVDALSQSALATHPLLSTSAAIFPSTLPWLPQNSAFAFDFTFAETENPRSCLSSPHPLDAARLGPPPYPGDSLPEGLHTLLCLHAKVISSCCEIHFLHTGNIFPARHCIKMLCFCFYLLFGILFWLVLWFVHSWPQEP